MKTAIDDPDRELVLRAKRGDEAAFRMLFERHAPGVRRIVSRYCKDGDEAADLVQEVFIRAFHAMRRFDGKSRFFTWLYRIAVNHSLGTVTKLRRRQRVELRSDDDVEEHAAISTPEETLAAKQVAAMVERAIEELRGEYRAALMMREVDELSYAEIAERLRIPLGTVRTRIFRGREAVAAALTPVRLSFGSGRF